MKGIRAGGAPTFSQRIRTHTVRRRPHYTVIVAAPGPYWAGSSVEPSSRIVQRGLWATSQGWPSGSVNAAV